MLQVRGGSFPQDMHGRIPMPMVKWVSVSHTLTKAANAPFMLELTDDSSQWSVTYQDTTGRQWHTRGGRTICKGNDVYVAGERGFWMTLRKL